MKVNKILVLGMLVTSIFASCSNEDTAENGSKGLVNGDAYITLSVSGSGIQGSRTTGVNHQNATSDESKINNLTLYLVDPTLKAVVFSTDVAAAQLNSNTAADPTYTTTPIPVTGVGTGTGVQLDTKYDVYVVANKTVNDIAMGNNWDATKVLSTTNSDATDFYKSATDDNFTMFNESNPGVNNPGVDASGKVTITSTNDSKSNPARVNASGTTILPIKLDRLTAKIQAQDGSASDNKFDISGITSKQANFIKEISMVGYVILNGVKSTYLQQTWSVTKESYVLNTPSSNNFYGQFGTYATIDRATAGSYTTLKDNTSTSDSHVSFTEPAKPVYCLENNTEVKNSDDKVTNTTGLIYKYQVTVNGSDGLAGSNCFYGYKGQYFATLDAIKATYPNVFGTSAATDLQTAKDLLKNGTETATEQSISDFRAKYNIEVFRNGIMYYTYFIKDQNYTDPTITTTNADKHIYAVLRNTVYDLHVASLLRIGNDIPGGWNPGDENTTVDKKDYYMQVQVSVNPWVLSSTDINLQ